MKRAIFPLSADPIHNGHLYDIETVANLGVFDEIYVAISLEGLKQYMFDLGMRVELAKRAIAPLHLENVKVEGFSGSLRNYALERDSRFIIRGARNHDDFEYEKALADYNLQFGLKTFIIPSTPEMDNVSSRYIKGMVAVNDFVDKLVHPSAKQALEEKIWGRTLIGVTGNMGCGKTTFCKKMVDYLLAHGVEAAHIDLDRVIHSMFDKSDLLYENLREKLTQAFGPDCFQGDDFNRKKMAGITFGEGRELLNSIVNQPAMVALEREVSRHRGIVLLDAAYIVEYKMLPMVNYNMILLKCEQEERKRRVLGRDNFHLEEIEARFSYQLPQEKISEEIKAAQVNVAYGTLIEVDNSNSLSEQELTKIAEKIQGL